MKDTTGNLFADAQGLIFNTATGPYIVPLSGVGSLARATVDQALTQISDAVNINTQETINTSTTTIINQTNTNLTLAINALSKQTDNKIAAALAQKGVLSIKSGAFTSQTPASFAVGTVISNTLLKTAPTDSNIIIPTTGNYIANTTVKTCIGGASTYSNAYIHVNGNVVAYTMNDAKACGSAVASTAIYLKKGDIISGKCHINEGNVSECSFSLARL